MIQSATRKFKVISGIAIVASVSLGAVVGSFIPEGTAQTKVPTEHKGLKVETLGMVPEDSLEAQLGLKGRILLLRAITIEPGGHIARHSHADVPGLVKVVQGEWTEGSKSGETIFNADSSHVVVEDKDTVHWFFNRGDQPATAYVCDIKPAS